MSSASIVATMVNVDDEVHHRNQDDNQAEAATREADSRGSTADSADTTPARLSQDGFSSSDPAQQVVPGKLYLSLDVGAILEKHRVQNHEALSYIDKSTHSITAQHADVGEECMICLDEMVEGHLVSSLPCGHTFHYECISNWLKTKLLAGCTGCCPNCNLQIIIPVVPPPAEHVVVIADDSTEELDTNGAAGGLRAPACAPASSASSSSSSSRSSACSSTCWCSASSREASRPFSQSVADRRGSMHEEGSTGGGSEGEVGAKTVQDG
eukprot:CAMPEP_0202809338 /NCGR_PEP_ID=MMETSP1389-20130828/1662_1 /ASSEMBLY_ACC=CAM_ASM_000865 /TAXON_ID=302021 /ORGANISM="Rhodomonas sp., Strain CCMP768" /LENGTH=267 /DNA_ID=CAMNT_0049479907 /DNA_START=86 /DNA_END=887 /DNA_ORIENTATION=+